MSEPRVETRAETTGRDFRVCHVIDTLRYGGAERQFVNIVNKLPTDRRYAVVLRDFPDIPGFRGMLDKNVEVLSMSVRLRYAPFYVWRLAKWLRDQRIDVVHTHQFWPTVYGAVAARLAGVTVVVATDHGVRRKPNSLVTRWLDGYVIPATVDRRYCVSDNVYRFLNEQIGVPCEKLELVFNGTEVPVRRSARSREPFRIGTVGRMVWQKDFATLIRAAGGLKQRGMEFRLTIVGDGPLRESLESEVEKHGLREVVNFPGYQDDIDKWLTEFDLFVLSSVEEGQPVALLEAMARGLPVVATRVGGIPATIRDGQEGVLVMPGSPEQLAEAIFRLSGDAKRRSTLGEKAKERVIGHYSTEVLVRHYMQRYAALWAEKTG